jgi:hypothetical protein
MSPKKQPESVDRSATLSIPELDESKAAVLNTLASHHSRRSYEYAIERWTKNGQLAHSQSGSRSC